MNFLNNINLNDIINFLTSADAQERLFTVRLIFLVVSGLLLAFIIFFLSKTNYLKWKYFRDVMQFLTIKPYGAKRITKSWSKIKDYLNSGLESEYKIAVIEADNMLDNSLKRIGYAGSTLEERLSKMTSATLPNIKDVYDVHKIRNSIVHDPNFSLSLDDAKKILDIYEIAFKNLQVLG